MVENQFRMIAPFVNQAFPQCMPVEKPQSEQHASTGHISYASETTPSVVCGRINIGGTSDDTEHKISRKIKKVRRGGKGKHKHGMQCCNVYYVNINGFKSKIGSLQKILDEQNVGILLLTETKVYSKQSIKLHGY